MLNRRHNESVDKVKAADMINYFYIREHKRETQLCIILFIFNTDCLHMYVTVTIILGVKTNVRESRRCNQEWISRDTGNIGHQKKEKEKKHSTTQNAENMSNTDPTENLC